MGNTVNDPVFGEMSYDHSWETTQTILLWGKEHKIRIAARAYNNDPVNDSQRASYTEYKAKESEYERLIPDVLLDYFKENYDEISEMVDLPEKYRLENISRDIVIKLIKPKTLFFAPDGGYGFLCDCAWDPEHGIAIIFPYKDKEKSLRIGDQDELI